MDTVVTKKNRRILVIDDNEDIHNDFRRVLRQADTLDLDRMESVLFKSERGARAPLSFEITSVYQGQEALTEIRRALKDGAPYALAFVDMRMPPGWDGVETLRRLWEEDPSLQAVICSAYADYSWDDIVEKLGHTDRLLVLKKPFDAIEVRQMACALTEKWSQYHSAMEAAGRLHRSEADNRALLHALPDTILRVSRDGTCLDFKASRDPSPSLKPRFSVERRLEEALPGEVAQELMRHVERALADSTTQVFEYQQPVGGEVREFEARVAGIEPSEAVVIIRDITESKLTKAEAEQRRVREETIRVQAETLLSLSTPLIPITDTIVVMPLIGALDAPRMQQIQTALVQGISAHHTRVVILDITGVTDLSPEAGDEIVRATQAARMLGAEVILTGIQPEIARILISQGRDLRGVSIHRTLKSGVASALRGR